jgi:hypothetical protein
VSANDHECLFDTVVFLVASARDTLAATPAYGAFRMLDAVTHLAPLAGEDDYLVALAARIERGKRLLMDDATAYTKELDALLEEVAAEAKRRNLERR